MSLKKMTTIRATEEKPSRTRKQSVKKADSMVMPVIHASNSIALGLKELGH